MNTPEGGNGRRWQLTEVPMPEPGRGQVVIKVGGAGACHSDLHLMHDFEAGQLPWDPPFTLGHETAGWVSALGVDITGLEVGQPVAVYGCWGCGHCARCRLGVDTYCENPAAAPAPGGGGGLGVDGGLAEYLLVPDQRHLVPLPAALDPVLAAPLTDAGLTPYHAVRRSWPKLAPGTSAVVIGVGGLGHLGVQILKATTAATVIAVDTRPEALALGAAVARPLGDLTIVGIGGGTLPVSFFSVPYELSIQTTYWGSRPELEEVLILGASGRLRPRIPTFPLTEAMDAYRQMEAGKLEGRAVIVPTRAG